jgi:putative sigma-54 modulation protein
MKIEYTGRNFTVTPAIRKHISAQFKKTDAVLGAAIRAHVILSVEKHHRHVAEVVVHWMDRALTSKADTTDMYVSATQAIDKVRSQALKLKEKRVDRKQQAKPASQVAPSPQPPVKPTPPPPRIVRSRKYSVKPMTPEEAIMRLEEAAEQFVVFRNADSERVGVLYKRKDGNYGLIEP